jgi:Flp pilus assembly protein TadB
MGSADPLKNLKQDIGSAYTFGRAIAAWVLFVVITWVVMGALLGINGVVTFWTGLILPAVLVIVGTRRRNQRGGRPS